MKFYSSLLLPKWAKNSALQAQESPSFLSLFDMRLRHTFSRLLKTSGYWRWQKECIEHCANEKKWEKLPHRKKPRQVKLKNAGKCDA
jgi:hypothetical protein